VVEDLQDVKSKIKLNIMPIDFISKCISPNYFADSIESFLINIKPSRFQKTSGKWFNSKSVSTDMTIAAGMFFEVFH